MILYNVTAPYIEVSEWFTSLPKARIAYRAAVREQVSKEKAEELEGSTAPVELTQYSTSLTGRELARRLLSGEGWAEQITPIRRHESKSDKPREAFLSFGK